MRIQIICKGSSKIGLGHLFRAHSFAAKANLHHEVRIAAVCETHLEKVFNGLRPITDIVQHDADVIPLIADYDADVILFDFIDMDEAVLAAARKQAVVTASLSPIFKHPEYLDALFTRNPDQEDIPGVDVYKGYGYALFKEHCRPLSDDVFAANVGHDVLPVAVCMGGGDAANKTLMVLRSLLRVERDCLFWVLLGEGYQHSYQQLVDVSREFSNHEVILAKTNRSMWRVMGNCAMAVLAGGLTTVEAVYAGLPTVNLFERPEHKSVMTGLIEHGACLDGGLFSPASLDGTASLIGHLHRNRGTLMTIRERGKGLFDANGGCRILRALENLLGARRLQSTIPAQLLTPATVA